MEIDRIEIKFATDNIDAKTGAFSGWGAVYGNVDSHGDIMVPGSVSDSLKSWAAKGRMPPMRLMHGLALNPIGGEMLPVGVWTKISEDANGIRVEGKLSALDSDLGKRLYGLMQDGALGGLSIGYKTVKASPAPRGASYKRTLEVVDLKEISIVDEPSNDRARMDPGSLKIAAGALSTEHFRDIEAALRTKGLSRSDAVKAVSGLKEWLRREAGVPDTAARDERDAALADQIRRNIATLRT